VAFIGDDINDLSLLKVVGFSGAPANAPEYIKKYAKYVTTKLGGEGAFREFVEAVLNVHNDNIEGYLNTADN
jgi:3-deoxy-D-manno-octulosonate 8-phosphate phosphatase KdsC-like HAD superfamily phosphatase